MAEDRYLITQHAQQRMGWRKITHADVKHVVTAGDVVERYPDKKPDPKARNNAACLSKTPAPAAKELWSARPSPTNNPGAVSSLGLRMCLLLWRQCGEVFLEAEVGQLIERILKEHPQPKKYHQVPVFSLAEFSF